MITTTKFTAESLYEKLKNVKVGSNVCQFSLKKCEEIVPLINEINELKVQKNAVILTHSYVSPELIYGVGDHVGDSYKLSKDAMASDAELIVFASVRFMGETAQIVNPDKQVLIPGELDGCTLADSINAEQVRRLRGYYPDHTFVCYINTTAEVKAECDVCVTSGNVYDIVQTIENDKIYFLPDKLMGQNLQNEMHRRGIRKDIQYYGATCYVHEEYDVEDLQKIRLEYPKAKIVSHPECSTDVCENSDYVGSTEQMLEYMRRSDGEQFLMLTECGLSARLQTEFPEKQLVGTCTLCKYMKSNTLENIRDVLVNPQPHHYVNITEDVRARAQKTIEAMFEYVEKSRK